MKRIIATILVLGLAGSILMNGVAYADDEAIAAVGGFLGGMVIGSAIADSRPRYNYYYSNPVPVYNVYHSRPAYSRYYGRRYDRRCGGYYYTPSYRRRTVVREYWY